MKPRQLTFEATEPTRTTTCEWNDLPTAVRLAEQQGYHVASIVVERGTYTLTLSPKHPPQTKPC